MSQISPNLDPIVTQDRHGMPSPLIRTCRKLELEEDSLMQENMSGEGRTEASSRQRFGIHTDILWGHRWCGCAVFAPTGILVCFKYLTFLRLSGSSPSNQTLPKSYFLFKVGRV